MYICICIKLFKRFDRGNQHFYKFSIAEKITECSCQDLGLTGIKPITKSARGRFELVFVNTFVDSISVEGVFSILNVPVAILTSIY